MLSTYYREYTLDNGKKVNITFRYEEGTGTNRLQIGGFPTDTTDVNVCKFSTTRKQLKPRSVLTRDKGLIYFQTHAKWLQFINNQSNRANIKRITGEDYSCQILG